MSHFVIITLLPKESSKAALLRREMAEQAIEPLLAPYSENLDVEPYQRACKCAEYRAHTDARNKTAEVMGDFDNLRASFNERIEKDPILSAKRKEDPFSEEIDVEWKAHIKDWVAYEDSSFGELVKIAKPLLDCEECKGTGFYESTYPPSVWRWVDAEGNQVDITRGDEILPNMREASPEERLRAGYEIVGPPVFVLQKVHKASQSRSDSRGPETVAPQREVQNDTGGIPKTSNKTEEPLLHLQESSLKPTISGGSRPSDGSDKEAALHSLQWGSGASKRLDSIITDDGKISKVFRKHLIAGAKWDWYQIGGRWTGFLSPDYDPRKDPANIETCKICNGSVVRHDMPVFGEGADPFKDKPIRYEVAKCNGCDGEGKSVKWTLEDYSGDVVPATKWLALLDQDAKAFTPFAVVTPDGEWHERGEMHMFAMVSNEKDKDVWSEEVRRLAEQYANDSIAVVCDCHI